MKKFKKKPIIVKCGADFLLPLAIVFGSNVILHGHISAGGGFQGGVLVASAILMVFLAYGNTKAQKTFNEHFLHSSETIAEIIYVLLAFVGVFAGLNFCFNFVFEGPVFDTSVLMNHAVGYHVMGGIICLLIMMLSLLDRKEDDFENHEIKEDNV